MAVEKKEEKMSKGTTINILAGVFIAGSLVDLYSYFTISPKILKMSSSDIEVFKVLAVLEIVFLTAIILRRKWGVYGYVLLTAIGMMLTIFKGNLLYAVLPLVFIYFAYRYLIAPEWKNFR